jgi:hypothetical protein
MVETPEILNELVSENKVIEIIDRSNKDLKLLLNKC